MAHVLVTGAASAVAYKLKSLFSTDALVLGDYEPLPPIASLKGLPSPSSPSYIADFLKLCLEENITEVYPIRRKEIAALLTAKQLLKEYDIQLFVPIVLDLTQIPAFQTGACLQLKKCTDGLFWYNEHGQYLIICD